MDTYDINNYDFYADKDFQAFLKAKIPNYLPRDKYIRQVISCKKEWLRLQNNVNFLLQKRKRETEE